MVTYRELNLWAQRRCQDCGRLMFAENTDLTRLLDTAVQARSESFCAMNGEVSGHFVRCSDCWWRHEMKPVKVNQ